MTPEEPFSTPLPETCGVAFKEWEGVCRALMSGRQSLILRKGGIDEGPGGFAPDHDAFWLYPTQVHQAQQGLKPEARDGIEPGTDPANASTVALRAVAVVAVVGRVDSLERLCALDDLHVWTAETVETRFRYRRPGLWVLGVRVYRRDEPIRLPVTAEHAGCKTWVPLDDPPSTAGLAPALDAGAFGEQMRRLRAAVDVPAGG